MRHHVIRLAAAAVLLSADLALAQEAAAPWDYAYNAEPFAGGVIREIFCDIVGLMDGPLGALVLTSAGVLAVGQAAFGR